METSLLFATLICYLGLPAGIIISKFSMEELKAGKIFFLISQKLAIVAIVAIFTNYLGLGFWIKAPIYLALIVFLGFNISLASSLIFSLLGFMMFSLRNSRPELFLISSLIFIYAVLEASIISGENKKMKTIGLIKEAAIKNCGLIASVIILSLVFN